MKFLPFFATALLLATTSHAAVGPISPEKNPSTRLAEAIRRMRLSLDRELLYLARAEEAGNGAVPVTGRADDDSDADPSESPDDGFTDEVNTGEETFAPIRPGTTVPAANEFDDEDEPTPEPNAPTASQPPTPTETPEPIVSQRPPRFTPVETPDFDPVVTPPVSTLDPSEPSDTPEPSLETVVPRETPPVVSSATPELDTPEPSLTNLPSPLPSPSPFDPFDSPLPSASMPPSVSPESSASADPSTTPAPLENGVDGVTPTPDVPEVSETPEATEPLAPNPSPGTSPEGDPQASPDDGNVCFPADATVEVEDGSVKEMSQVQLGDRIRVGPNAFSEVFMFTHKMSNVQYSFVNIRTQSGHRLSLTKGHYLYVNGVAAAADTVRPGDALTLADHTVSSVIAVDVVSARGLYNPQTVHGDIIVNGVRATTYTTAVEMGAAHSLLAPLRAVYSTIGWTLSAFDSGADRLASLVPSGSLIV